MAGVKEADLHAAVVQSLKLLLPADCVMHHSPNEGKRSFLTGKLQLCLRECVLTNGKWVCPKCGEVK